MDTEDTLDIVVIALLLNEARKCLDIITDYNEDDGEENACEEDEVDEDDSSSSIPRVSLSPPEEVEVFDKKFDFYFEKICHRDPEEFKDNVRMSVEVFELLYNLMKPDLRKYSIRPSITPKCSLFITLVYLASGGSRKLLCSAFDMPPSTMQGILTETCRTLWKTLADAYLPKGRQSQWIEISKQFESDWHIPNCVGAIDVKMIEMRCTSKDISNFTYKKGRYVFAILGVCDANYMFTGIDFTTHGCKENFKKWTTGFEKKLFEGSLNLPRERRLPNSDIRFPYYFIGDLTYPLKPHIMRAYPGKSIPHNREVYNSRLSRARQVIDNAFGVLAARWKILTSSLFLSPQPMEQLVKATIVLHNFARTHDITYCPPEYVDRYEGDTLIPGYWRSEVTPLQKTKRVHSNNATHQAFKLRDELCEYIQTNPIE